MATSLTANPEFICVDTRAGERTGTTRITYDGGGPEIVLWERFDGSGKWRPVNLFTRVGTRRAEYNGAFDTPSLTPGQSYELRMFDQRSADPNVTEHRPIATLTVVALQKDGRSDLITHQVGSAIGGTFRRDGVNTAVPTSFTIEVSHEPPVPGDCAIPRFRTVVARADDTAGFLHVADLQPLLPGNTYFSLIRVVDAAGRWQVQEGQFTTLRRTVTVNFVNLHIDNDGDPGGDGEGYFSFEIREGRVPVRQFTVGKPLPWPISANPWDKAIGDISDKIGRNNIPLSFTHTIGPSVVTEATAKISIALQGVEVDGVLESDEYATHFGQALNLPSGPGEVVLDRSQDVHAPASSVDDDFAFTVTVRFSTQYAP